MSGFDHGSQADAIRFIRENIDRHTQFALGTVDPDGNPWVVCLNLAYDERFNIIWKSLKTTEHSKHIAVNPNVAICIFSEAEDVGDFGIYAKATVREVTDETELNRLLDIRFGQKGKPIPPVSDFLGGAEARIYFAELKELWLNDNSHEKIKVELSQL